MDKLIPIRFNLHNQAFTIQCKPEEEGKVRLAAKLVEQKINSYHATFSKQSFEEIILMVAYHETLERLRLEDQTDVSPLIESIEELDKQISISLAK